MAENLFRCGKCGAAVSPGFIVDRSEHSFDQLRWIEGEPEQRRMLGMKLADIEIKDRRQFKVRAARCEQCGLLELYAV